MGCRKAWHGRGRGVAPNSRAQMQQLAGVRPPQQAARESPQQAAGVRRRQQAAPQCSQCSHKEGQTPPNLVRQPAAVLGCHPPQ